MAGSQTEYDDYKRRNPSASQADYERAYGYSSAPAAPQRTDYSYLGDDRSTAFNNNDAHSPSAFSSYEDWKADFLERNPGDEHRATQREYESNRQVPDAQIGDDGSVVSGNAAQATSQYSGGGSGSGGGGYGQMESTLAALLQQLTGDRQRQEEERSSLRAMLMSQLDGLDNPVSLNDPGIREAVTANRNSLQRGGEQQRREIAERRAYDDSGGIGSKAYMTDVDRLGQQSSEAGAQFEGQIMFQEMQQRRTQLQQLLSQALALGDSESARNIQAQLNAIQMQMNENGRLDDMGYRYAALQAALNQGAVSPFLA
jgi:hypothetical protein